jgi:thioredoxin 1
MVLEVDDSNFDEIVLKSDKPVLVDFWAEWCGPCRMVAPLVKELSEEFDGKAVMVKVDIETATETANKYKIRNIPTLLFFKGGQQVDKHVGATQKKVLAGKIEALI